ncbi:MAG: fumarylacetoacetate hydrolase family protein [Planctomycetota bacterium]|nr:fumarylacetoacetate hydrolase family protein [Planctomycetota bacterium]
MRLCRFTEDDTTRVGFYLDDRLVRLDAAGERYRHSTHKKLDWRVADDILRYLPPDGPDREAASRVAAWLDGNPEVARDIGRKTADARILAPIPRPPKLLLLAGNYAAHIREGGGLAVERAKTFPYVFMKPPTTTINHPGADIAIPAVSPDHIDWEVELGVIIGRRARRVREDKALEHVAGFTVVNDLSDRRFRPNPGRVVRQKDTFFDWLHGKWHDGFCPQGPCVLSAADCPDPQKFHLSLRVNGDVKQDSSTANQIFPVAAVVAFISSFVTLEPGDVISTGTPSGVGNTTKTYLQPGDVVEARIDTIGTLRNRMVADAG